MIEEIDELTPEQRRAAEILDRHVVVTAGPGSGKTRVLVSRFLNILDRAQVDLDRIVAITFTKKAASERCRVADRAR